jgi:hypothetical protein
MTLPAPSIRRNVATAAAPKKKGFGAAAPAAAKSAAPKTKQKQKSIRAPSGPIPPSQPPAGGARGDARYGDATPTPSADAALAALADANFDAKLAALAAKSKRLEAERKLPVTILEGVPDYDRPPTLAAALRGETSGAIADAKKDGVSVRAGVGAAAGALALAAIFLFTSGGGGGGGPAPSRAPSVRLLSEAEKVEVAGQLDAYKATLATTPGDAAALRGAASAAAALGKPKDAIAYLETATKAAPSDAESWAELGAAKLSAGDAKGAVAALERATAESPVSPPPLALAATLANARVASGNPGLAAAELGASRDAAAKAGGGDAAAASYDLGLLQARVFAEWPRHAPDADAVYGSLTAERPTDFRAWLARGALARGNGRPADAARYFLQARYLAADEGERATVDAVAGAQQQ